MLIETWIPFKLNRAIKAVEAPAQEPPRIKTAPFGQTPWLPLVRLLAEGGFLCECECAWVLRLAKNLKHGYYKTKF